MNAWLFKYLVDVIVMGSKCSKNVAAAYPPFHIFRRVVRERVHSTYAVFRPFLTPPPPLYLLCTQFQTPLCVRTYYLCYTPKEKTSSAKEPFQKHILMCLHHMLKGHDHGPLSGTFFIHVNLLQGQLYYLL